MTQPGLRRPLSAAELSDGTLTFLLLVAAAHATRPPDLLVLNEPESSLHPSLMPAVGALVASAAERSQVLVVTHAGDLVRALRTADATTVELTKGAGRPPSRAPGCSTVRRGRGRSAERHAPVSGTRRPERPHRAGRDRHACSPALGAYAQRPPDRTVGRSHAERSALRRAAPQDHEAGTHQQCYQRCAGEPAASDPVTASASERRPAADAGAARRWLRASPHPAPRRGCWARHRGRRCSGDRQVGPPMT